MLIETIQFNQNTYPKFQSTGGASLFCREIAMRVCKGSGLDIGYSKHDWKLPGAFGIEPTITTFYDAMHLPEGPFDYIHSSHCLEHVKENWYNVIDYWLSRLKPDGVLFLYLPHKSQEYWLPRNNRKHVHSFDGTEIKAYLEECGCRNIFLSGVDINHSFILMCNK